MLRLLSLKCVWEGHTFEVLDFPCLFVDKCETEKSGADVRFGVVFPERGDGDAVAELEDFGLGGLGVEA